MVSAAEDLDLQIADVEVRLRRIFRFKFDEPIYRAESVLRKLQPGTKDYDLVLAKVEERKRRRDDAEYLGPIGRQ
jgi:hypothetical protein